MTETFLESVGLTKAYDGKTVVNDLEIRCSRGEVLGLLGPNGAGKTTTLRMLYGFVEPDRGTIRYGDQEFSQHRTDLKRLIGVCTQDDSLDYDFTVRQNLEIYAGYFRPGLRNVKLRASALLEQFGLVDFAHMSPRALSGGYKQRLLLARSIIHEPSILFLDEPTTGLDPKARVDVWQHINSMKRGGMAIVLTTHYMDEAERLSDNLVVMSAGEKVSEGIPGDVVGSLVGEHVVVVENDGAWRDRVCAWAESVTSRPPSAVLNELRLALNGEQLRRWTEEFSDVRFAVRPPTLDDLFLHLADKP